MFIPECGCCGRCGCKCGVLPHTITAKFSGFTQQTTTAWRTASASPTCFGSLAEAAIQAPGGKGNNGPIQTVAIVNPGQCYAERDRVMPVLRAIGTGRGAVMDVTVIPDTTDGCNRPRWKISSISVTGGTGYSNGSAVTITPSPGDVVLEEASATVKSSGGVPTSVTVNNSGRYYRPITGDRDVPIVTATIGGGARLSVGLEQLAGDPPRWKVASVGVSLAGSGISNGAAITFAAGDLTTITRPAAATAIVDAAGTISAVTVTDGGEYYRNTNLPPRVADVSFNFPVGAGAVVKGVVEDDPDDPRFGQVVDLKIQSGGSGYLGWTLVHRCQTELNGREIVLRAEDSGSLVTPCVSSNYGSGALLEVVSHTRPRLNGRTAGSAVNNLSVILEETGKAPKTWQVARVLAGQVGGNAGDPVSITAPPGVVVNAVAVASITAVDDGVPIIAVSEPGEFYSQATDWDGLVGPIPGVRVVAGGSGYAKIARTAPTLSGMAGGDEVTLTVSQGTDDDGLPYWKIKSVSGKALPINEGGLVTITPDPFDDRQVAEVPALVVAHTRQEPEITVEAPGGLDPEPEEEAEFTVVLGKSQPASLATEGSPPVRVQSAFWYVSEVVVDNPGRGYPPLFRLEFSTDDEEIKPAAALAHADKLGRVTSVALETIGEYYRASNTAHEYTIARSGVYYRSDRTLPPYVSNRTVSLLQIPPSNGSGAVISTSVDLDPYSETFGQIKSATVASGGSGYMLRGGPGNCVYSHRCPERGQSIRVNVAAANLAAQFIPGELASDATDASEPTRWTGVLANTTPVADCSALPTTALTPRRDIQNGQITVTHGGQYHAFTPCCYCPCDKAVDFKDLVPCGVASIIVAVTVTVADNGDPGRCNTETVTLTLTGEPGRNMWYAEDDGEQFQTVAFLNCVEQRLSIVGAFNGESCSSAIPNWIVPLGTTPDPDTDTCCPTGGSVTIGDPLDVQVTVDVTVVME